MSAPANPGVSGSGAGAPSSGTPAGGGVGGSGGGPFDTALEVAALYDRVRKLESPGKEKSDHWYSSSLFSSVLSGIILAAFGFFLTGRLDQASKERSLNIQSAKDMQEMLLKLSTGSKDEAESGALALTVYGKYAIPPLVDNLQYAQRAVAAEHALVAMALTNSQELCSNFSAVLETRTQRYTAAGNSAVIRILGAGDCRTAETSLRNYADLIKRADANPAGLAEFQQAVRDATPSNVADAKKDLLNTFKLLHVDYAF